MRYLLEIRLDDEDYNGARNHEAASKFFGQVLFGPDIGHQDRSAPKPPSGAPAVGARTPAWAFCGGRAHRSMTAQIFPLVAPISAVV
jgi:hypothetical protein